MAGLRKDLNVKSGTGMQVFATVVANSCYRIYADIRGVRGRIGSNPRLPELYRRLRVEAMCPE